MLQTDSFIKSIKSMTFAREKEEEGRNRDGKAPRVGLCPLPKALWEVASFTRGRYGVNKIPFKQGNTDENNP